MPFLDFGKGKKHLVEQLRYSVTADNAKSLGYENWMDVNVK